MELDQRYEGQGISFGYPAGWELTEEARSDAFTVTVGDAGPFWSVTILRQRPSVARVLDEACGAFRDEYEDIDEYPVEATLGGEEVAGRNLEFVSLELINCVMLRAVQVGGRTLFIMAQVTDHEREQYEEVFQQIGDSLKCDPDEEIIIE